MSKCPECDAPPGDCWSQSGSMGGSKSCYRDKTVAYGRADWLAHSERLHNALQNLLNMYVSLIDSGDCGFSESGKLDEVIAARKALES